MASVHEKTSGDIERVRQRGGSRVSPLRVSQLTLATAILIAASIMLILNYWAFGFALVIIGLILCFL